MVGLIAAFFSSLASVFAVSWLGWGILGIAAAIAITAILETLALTYLLHSRISKGLETLEVFISLSKMIFISFITGLGLWIPMRLLDKFVFDTTRTIPLILLTLVTSIIGFGVYILLSYIFRIKEISAFADLLKRVMRWKDIFTSPPAEPMILPAPEQN